VDIHLMLLDEMQEQIERTLERIQPHAIRLGYHTHQSPVSA
jgi:hypothetical protein